MIRRDAALIPCSACCDQFRERCSSYATPRRHGTSGVTLRERRSVQHEVASCYENAVPYGTERHLRNATPLRCPRSGVHVNRPRSSNVDAVFA